MNKIISLALALAFVATIFSGCSNQTLKDINNEVPEEEKIRIVTTIFPIYDWTREIIGENNEKIDLKLLIKNGADLHSYQPSSEDMIAIKESDIFVYVGGHSDVWVDSALKNANKENRENINLFEVLEGTLKPLVITEGMEHSHNGCSHHHEEGEHHHEHEGCEHHHEECSHHHEEGEHHHEHEGCEHHHEECSHHHEEGEHHHEHEDCENHHDHKAVNDEHIWLSLNRAKEAINAITEAVSLLDSENKDIYMNNAKEYINKLELLNEKYLEVAKEGKESTIIVADRFPFFYMADDYGLKYYAAFTGCSADSEASFKTVALLAKKIDELGIENIIAIENRNHKIPETVIENTKNKNQNIVVMNSLQSVTEKQITGGLKYLDVMEGNLDILKRALKQG